jgi:cysteine desulfurase/selenocysteine lyase
LIDSLCISGTVRASFGMYNTKAEIDIFIAALKKVVTMLS